MAKDPGKTNKNVRSQPSQRLSNIELHRIAGDSQRLMKTEWADDGTLLNRMPINIAQARRITAKTNAPFCFENIEQPGTKYYYYWDERHNMWAYLIVPADDPRCKGI